MSTDQGMDARARERPVGLVRGTRDRLPTEFARLAAIESSLLAAFGRAGYSQLHIPVLERTDLHERKSGAGIVSKLYELAGEGEAGVCLRPELTAGVVRAYAEAPESITLPWRVSVSGPVFRHDRVRRGFLREFHQVGVEMLGGGPEADVEVIWLAWQALTELGVADSSLRIGHVGLLLEMLDGAGLPEAARAALVERLSEAASEGRGVQALEEALDQFAASLQAEKSVEEESVGHSVAFDRLFHTLVPDVVGRRSAADVVGRLRRKWEWAHSLGRAFDRLRSRIDELGALAGPAAEILTRLDSGFASVAPESVAAIRNLIAGLVNRGADIDRIVLDLGFGRGIGFYSRMVFELLAGGPEPVEVCGGGRYDGLARVLGTDRDDRGVGFAFGLERLDSVLNPAAEEAAR